MQLAQHYQYDKEFSHNLTKLYHQNKLVNSQYSGITYTMIILHLPQQGRTVGASIIGESEDLKKIVLKIASLNLVLTSNEKDNADALMVDYEGNGSLKRIILTNQHAMDVFKKSVNDDLKEIGNSPLNAIDVFKKSVNDDLKEIENSPQKGLSLFAQYSKL